ncbi:hypothetical protein ACWDA3_56035 [Nonomuraea rubra]
MAYILTKASTVRCGPQAPHTGTVATGSTARLTVGGSPVLVADSIKDKDITGCQQKGNNTTPCLKAGAPLQPGLATRLTTGGAPVVLSTRSGVTNGTPPGAMSATGGSEKVTAT